MYCGSLRGRWYKPRDQQRDRIRHGGQYRGCKPKPRKFHNPFNISVLDEFQSASGSVLPKIPEPVRSQVCEVLLNRPRVLPIVGEFVTGRMTQHVRMNGEVEAGLSASAL
jgi:hypothetical protein